MNGYSGLNGVATLVAFVALASMALCNGASALDAQDQGIINEWKRSVLDLQNVAQFTDGEDITWRGSPYLRGMVTMVAATGDTDSADMFCKVWEHLQAAASKDIDGLLGWPTEKGSYGRNGRRCIPMDDAIITQSVARFASAVRANPALKVRYGERAESYVAWVEQNIWPKWEDSWLDLSGSIDSIRRVKNSYQPVKIELEKPCGLYRYYNPGKQPGMSLPLNQFLHVAVCYLDFYDATGKEWYLDKAKKMALAAKQIYLVPEGDRWSHWNYWQPVWEGDFKRRNDPVHWVGPHPYRTSYASGEVSMMSQFHKRGLVFTDEDMQRFVRRQLDVLWNGDREEPKFEFTMEGREDPYPASLWGSLAYVDPTIKQLSSKNAGRDGLAELSAWQRISAVPSYYLSLKSGD